MKRIRLLLPVFCAALLIVTAYGVANRETTTVDAATPVVAVAAYSDQSYIGAAYAQAVERMTEQNVLQGYDDGQFHPVLMLTREQGAKIVTYLILSPEQAEKLTCETAPYNDVTADRWSAACIAWCTDHEILAGYGDGNYGPADQLTGRQFARMLLSAYELGDPNRYLGDSWAESVSTDGAENGLFEGDEAMNSDQPLQRQQAALMADNAQKAKEKASESSNHAGNGSGGTGTSGGGNGSSGTGSSSGGNGGSSGSGSSSDVVTPEVEILSNTDSSTSDSYDDNSGSGSGGTDPNSNGTSSSDSTDNLSDIVVDDNGDILLPEAP